MKKNTLATAGGVLGIVSISLSLFLSWFIAPLFILLSTVAIALSGVGLKKAIDNDLPTGMAITGLATAIPTLLWNILWTLIVSAAIIS